MTRYVISPDVAIRLAKEQVVIGEDHELFAPTLFRSQLLSQLFQAVRQKKMSKSEADRTLDYVRKLPMRVLGDRVLQNVAWKIAEELNWPDTLDAEYIALTKLQADALITFDRKLAAAVKGIVKIAPYKALT